MRPEFMIDYRSKTGIEHQKRNLENQDACFSEIQEGKNACLCIADGAGSKKHAALGAQQLVQNLCTTLMQNASELFQKAEQEISDFLSEKIHRLLREVAKAKNVVACHAKRKKLTRKTKKTLLNTTFKSVFYYL